MDRKRTDLEPSGADAAAPFPPASGPLLARLREMRLHLWALPALIVLILARAVQISPSPAEFPLDRNMTLANRIRTIETSYQNEGGLGPNTRGFLLRSLPETPEVPLLPSGAWILSRAGIHPIVAARIISLLASLAVGLGLYLLGRRVAGALAGHLALWIFALDPFAIFMGRVLLPDGIMMAAIVWSFLAAGAGQSDWRPRRAFLLFFFLAFAILAKLPAALIAPAAALALIQTRGLRRRDGWIAAAIAAVAVYGVMCWWYEIRPWDPKGGLRALSQRTNNIMASSGELWDVKAFRVLGTRLTLALTLPGVWLAAAGLAMLQARRSNRLWLNAWAVLSILATLLTLKANTYWAYMVVPAGCLLAAMALAEFWRLHPLSLVPIALLTLAGLAASPAAGKVKSYFAVDPAYDEMRARLDGRITGPVLFYGAGPDDIQYFVNQPGRMINPNKLTDEIQSGFRDSDFLLTHQMLGHPLLVSAFHKYPVIATLGQRFVLFQLKDKNNLGIPEIDQNKTYPLNLSLGDQLVVRDANVELLASGPHPLAAVTVWYERGPAFVSPSHVSLQFVHRPSGVAFPVAPAEGGAYFKSWAVPLVQLPDFRESSVERMDYRFEFMGLIPDGDFTLQLNLLRDPSKAEAMAQVDLPRSFSFHRRPISSDSIELDPADGVWRNPATRQEPSWFGGQRVVAVLNSNAEVSLTAPVPAGKYILAVTARGVPVGDADQNRWPVLMVRQSPQMGIAARMKIEHQNRRIYEHPIDWKGPQDFISLAIGNAFFSAEIPDPFPLYLSDTIAGNRAVVLDKIELRRAAP